MIDPRIGPPLGLLYIAAWARRAGYDVDRLWKVVDLNTACYQPDAPVGHWTHDFSLARCLREIPTGADVYGLSLASMQMPHGVAIAEALREREPKAVLVCGGSHASAEPEECAAWFDYVVTREGERAFERILRELEAASRAGFAPGGYRPNGRIVRGEPVEPLDDAPIPARELLDFSHYTRRVAGGRATNIITERGCPAKCTFCQQSSLWGQGLRLQSPARILDEVDAINAMGIPNLLFLDDSLTARKRSDVMALGDGLRERGVRWRGWTRSNLCARPGDEELLRHMAASGCQALCLGIEAGTDRLLRTLDKGTTVEMNRRAIRNVREAGLDCRISIMVGSPGETEEDVDALIRFVEEVGPWISDWILSVFVPLPGTPAWEHPERYGLVIDKAKARAERYRHFFVVGGDEQSGLVHRFEDGTGPEEFQARHDRVQETLLRLAPRDRIGVTQGRAA